MSFAEGLLLAYLKVGMLAAAIMAVVWLICRAAVRLHQWERDATAAEARPKDPVAGDGDDGRSVPAGQATREREWPNGKPPG